jgi:hypothetical protein
VYQLNRCVQVDGEPWIQPAGDIVVLKSALKVRILLRFLLSVNGPWTTNGLAYRDTVKMYMHLKQYCKGKLLCIRVAHHDAIYVQMHYVVFTAVHLHLYSIVRSGRVHLATSTKQMFL